MKTPDEELIARVQQGDRDAFSALYRRYAGKIGNRKIGSFPVVTSCSFIIVPPKSLQFGSVSCQAYYDFRFNLLASVPSTKLNVFEVFI